jgi:hypothetical protein
MTVLLSFGRLFVSVSVDPRHSTTTHRVLELPTPVAPGGGGPQGPYVVIMTWCVIVADDTESTTSLLPGHPPGAFPLNCFQG